MKTSRCTIGHSVLQSILDGFRSSYCDIYCMVCSTTWVKYSMIYIYNTASWGTDWLTNWLINVQLKTTGPGNMKFCDRVPLVRFTKKDFLRNSTPKGWKGAVSPLPLMKVYCSWIDLKMFYSSFQLISGSGTNGGRPQTPQLGQIPLFMNRL